MNASGEFIFKNCTKREGGEFENDKRKTVEYDSCYILKVDEITDDIRERKFKFPIKNRVLYDDFCSLDSYTKVIIVFDVVIYDNSCKLIPVSFNIG